MIAGTSSSVQANNGGLAVTGSSRELAKETSDRDTKCGHPLFLIRLFGNMKDLAQSRPWGAERTTR